MHVEYLATRHSRLSINFSYNYLRSSGNLQLLLLTHKCDFLFPHLSINRKYLFLTDNSQSNHSGNEYGSSQCYHIYLITNVINILKWLKLSLTIFNYFPAFPILRNFTRQYLFPFSQACEVLLLPVFK